MVGKRLLSVFLSLALGKKTFDSSREKIQDIKNKTVKWCQQYMPKKALTPGDVGPEDVFQKTCANRFNKFYDTNAEDTVVVPQPRARKRFRKDFDLTDGPGILAKFGRRTSRFITQDMAGCKRGPMYKQIFANVIERFRNKQKIIIRRMNRLTRNQSA